MKTATLPALRVNPKLRDAAERALLPGETLSKLMEAALESHIDQRAAQQEFIARGLHFAQEARAQGQYISAATVVAKMEKKLAAAQRKAKRSTDKP
ncbi:YlcI/YnfO family protein [uncultured Ramlibacter sp.]|uniref:YlcI/YnfO family protein n=1 Tax=uncultured Ramlibacter sp. TaxID=260755 RepID=UPI0026209DA2|nr:YlcI/YnfO family protein [uncultured Ramlibacter sp.]